MPREIRIKQGASLLLQLTFQDDQGNPLDVTGFTLSSQVRDTTGDLIASLPIVLSETTGVATVTQSSTVLWPLGTLYGDLKAVTAGGLIVISETFGIRVERAVTQ